MCTDCILYLATILFSIMKDIFCLNKGNVDFLDQVLTKVHAQVQSQQPFQSKLVDDSLISSVVIPTRTTRGTLVPASTLGRL